MIKPVFEKFKDLKKQGNLIPVYSEIIADMETPVSVYYKIKSLFNSASKFKKYSFLLESVEGGENIGRYSFLGIAPHAILVQENGVAKLITETSQEEIQGQDVFEKVNKVMKKYIPVKLPDLPPFIGGAIGYASYENICDIEPSVSKPNKDILNLPDALFMITDTILAFDKVKQSIIIISHAHIKEESDIKEEYNNAIQKIKELTECIQQAVSFPTVEPKNILDEEVKLNSNKTEVEYKEMVRKIKKYIVDGDIIQAVVSQRFEAEISSSPLAIHRALRVINPSPYMFLLDYDDFSIVGASPEVMVKCEDREITVRPIAGTRVRGKNKQEDDNLADELINDPKERAEHIMLVDLGRNDIGRVSKSGSVKVDKLMTIERYSHVMHIVSNVTGELKDNLESDAAMRSTFPAGTLSGAPKVRAMQIISELEQERRGPYGGTIASFSFNGNLNSAITIRTAVLKDGKAYIQAGAGIVADSDPKSEYEETQNKAKGMIKALGMAKFFEIK